jgi:hypothetical protein
VQRVPRALIVLALAGGVAALAITLMGSISLGIAAGIFIWLSAFGASWWWARQVGGAADPGRRRFMAWAGVGGAAWVVGGTLVGRVVAKLTRPDAVAVQDAAAAGLGAEYMELVHRAYKPGRAGEIQLLLAPFNSANYAPESLKLVPNDPRTSHASVWMYLERVPLLVYGPGIVEPSDSEERVSLADLAPTTAQLIGMDAWPADRDGAVLPGLRATGATPKVVVTFVIDGGGWNVLRHWSDDWPNLKRLMHQGANYRNALTGSFPAVTACAHATIGTGAFPSKHGITGHNIRDAEGNVRKAYGEPGTAYPGDIALPTLADLWSDQTANQAWVGEIGYQVWHLGMLGYGGRNRTPEQKPVAVYWDEDGTHEWQPHNPDIYRMPASYPGLDVLAAHQATFQAPDWDAEFTPKGRQSPCCSPPVIEYQGDVIEAAFEAEPIGQTGSTDLLYINFKSPDYTGHIYNMLSKWEGLILRTVDAELQRVVELLEARFPGEYVLFVTADHGQCPTPDAVNGVRLDPIQLQRVIENAFGAGLTRVVEQVYPAEVFIDTGALWDAGATVDDVAAHLRHLTYRGNLGPYVPRNVIEQNLLDAEEFAGVFAGPWLERLDPSRYGDTIYTGDDVDPGVPPRSILD